MSTFLLMFATLIKTNRNMQVENKIELVRLLSKDGTILYKNGFMDFLNGVHDKDDNLYPAGFEADGTVHCTIADDNGQVAFEDGKPTIYNLNENYFHLVCLRVVYVNPKLNTSK